MQITELFEQDKERIRTAMAAAETQSAMQNVLEKEWERLQYRWLEKTEDPVLRVAGAGIFQTAKASSGLIDTDGEAVIWERAAGEGEQETRTGSGSKRSGRSSAARKQPHPKHAGVLFLLLGLLCIAAGGLLIWLRLPEFLESEYGRAAGILTGCGILCLFIAGLLLNRRSKTEEKKTQKVEVRPDAGKCFLVFQRIVLTIDKQLSDAAEELRRIEAERRGQQDAVLSKQEIELYSELLSAADSGDPEYAMDTLADVRHFLHEKHIEAVEYDDAHAAWFDLMPGDKKATIRPALVHEGKLLKKGMAADPG